MIEWRKFVDANMLAMVPGRYNLVDVHSFNCRLIPPIQYWAMSFETDPPAASYHLHIVNVGYQEAKEPAFTGTQQRDNGTQLKGLS